MNFTVHAIMTISESRGRSLINFEEWRLELSEHCWKLDAADVWLFIRQLLSRTDYYSNGFAEYGARQLFEYSILDGDYSLAYAVKIKAVDVCNSRLDPRNKLKPDARRFRIVSAQAIRLATLLMKGC